MVSTTVLLYATAIFHLTGLTPGALQLDLAAAYITGTGSSATIYRNATTGITANAPLFIQAKASV